MIFFFEKNPLFFKHITKIIRRIFLKITNMQSIPVCDPQFSSYSRKNYNSLGQVMLVNLGLLGQVRLVTLGYVKSGLAHFSIMTRELMVAEMKSFHIHDPEKISYSIGNFDVFWVNKRTIFFLLLNIKNSQKLKKTFAKN